MNKRAQNDVLVAEYVLGTLRGAARRRFELLMERDPDLAGAVCQWQQALGALDYVDTPVAPPARVWRTIQLRLPASHNSAHETSGTSHAEGASRQVAVKPPRLVTALTRRTVKRGWQFASFILAASLVAVLLWPRGQVPVGASMAPLPMVVLTSAQGSANRHIVVSIDTHSQHIVLTPMNLAPMKAGHSLELWMIGKSGKPAPLGLVRANARTVLAMDTHHLSPGMTLAVSLEPTGGSPTGQPTGAIMYAGKIGKV